MTMGTVFTFPEIVSALEISLHLRIEAEIDEVTNPTKLMIGPFDEVIIADLFVPVRSKLAPSGPARPDSVRPRLGGLLH